MIVVIEDDEMAGRLLTKILDEYFPSRKWVWVQSVADFIKFLDSVDISEIEIFLIDFYLPDGDVSDVMQQIRKRDCRAKTVLMPGIEPGPEERKIIANLEFDNILVKPLNVGVLKKVL